MRRTGLRAPDCAPMTLPMTMPTASGPTWQPIIGLALALAVFGGWVCLHAYALFVFELSWASLPLALTMALVLCWLSVGLFIVSHDAMHGSLVPGSPRANAAIGTVLLFLYAGFSFESLRKAHFAHHRHAGTARDPDFDAENPRAFWPWYATFLRRYFGLGSLIWVSCVVVTLWLALDVPVPQLLLLYALPAIASSLQLFYFGTYRPHRHADDAFVDRHQARSDEFGTLASFLTCFHFGYHLEHHQYPQLPWWALPSARRKAGAQQVEEGAGA